jgi:hypothetical protein
MIKAITALKIVKRYALTQKRNIALSIQRYNVSRFRPLGITDIHNKFKILFIGTEDLLVMKGDIV